VGWPVHKSITAGRILATHEDNEIGMGSTALCTTCGAEQSGLETDCENVICEGCGNPTVQGTLNLLVAVDDLSEANELEGKPELAELRDCLQSLEGVNRKTLQAFEREIEDICEQLRAIQAWAGRVACDRERLEESQVQSRLELLQ